LTPQYNRIYADGKKNVRRISEHNPSPNGPTTFSSNPTIRIPTGEGTVFSKDPVGLEIFGEIVCFLDGCCRSPFDQQLSIHKGNPGLGLAILEELLFCRASTLESSLCEMDII
jgi:hypothetical protein